MIDGKMFTVPEIKDSNKRENSDIRRRFGPPRGMDSAGASPGEKREGTKSTETQSGETGTAHEARLRNIADLSSLAFMSLPLAVVFFRLRRRR